MTEKLVALKARLLETKALLNPGKCPTDQSFSFCQGATMVINDVLDTIETIERG